MYSKQIPGFDGRYVITVTGEVFDLQLAAMVSSVTDRVKKVGLQRGGEVVQLEVGRIVVVMKHNLNIDWLTDERLQVGYTNADATDVHEDNVYYYFTQPIESADYPGYYHIPLHHRFVVSRAGVMIDTRSGKVKNWYIWKPPKNDKKNTRGGYRLTALGGQGKTLSRHRAVALTFISYPSNPRYLVVNHLNGVGGDDRLDNLEWTTRSGNTQHAYDSNLQPNNVRKVLVKEIATGEIASYGSIAECARMIKRAEATLTNRLKNNPGKAYSDGFAYKFDDDTPWVDGVVPERNDYSVACYHVATSEVTLVDNLRVAADFTQVVKGSIWHHIQQDSLMPIKGWVFRKLGGEPLVFPTFTPAQLELFSRYPVKTPVGYRVVDTVAESEWVASATDIAKLLGKGASQTHVILKQGQTQDGRYQFEYITPEGQYV